MKSFVIAALAAPALVAAHQPGVFAHALHARQGVAEAAATSAGASASAPPPPPPASTAPGAGTSSAAGAPPPVAAPSSVSFSIQSQNPTAIPIASITAGTLSDLTTATFATPAAAAKPTGIPNAPPLPDASLLKPTDYPQLDVIPPTDSPQVQQWIADVKASGVNIPGYAPTVAAGGCSGANQAAAAEDDRCWWTCGGCVRETDVQDCPQKLTWGLTYDDGPSWYTPNLLQYLDQNNLKATMFVVGSRAISYPHLLQAEYMAGHQIAVHTWSHHYLTSMTNEQIIAELGWSKKIIKDVLGVTPNFMRPPFGDIDDRVRNISIAMGLTPIMWSRISKTATFDTNDFTVAGGTTSVSQVLQSWEYIMGNATVRDTGFIVLEHDLFEQTVEIATGYILPDALARTPKINIMPVSQCLNMPLADAYIETNDNGTHPPALQAAKSSGSVVNTLPATGAAAQATGTQSGSNSNSTSSKSGAVRAEAFGAAGPLALLLAAAVGAGALIL